VFPAPGAPLGERDVVHIGLDAWELAKNQPSTVVFGHERLALRELISLLADRLATRGEDVQARRRAVEAELADARRRAREADRSRWDERPMTPERAVAELAARMPDDAILVDESLTAYAAVARYFTLRPGRWFRLRGGGIGAGMPMPVGVQLAHPDRPVVALVGDGSAIYTISALWTAAHHRLPITWVILNNRGYRTLKENARRGAPDVEPAHRLTGADLTEPVLDFVSLAHGMGVRAYRVTDPEYVGDIFAAALAADHPVLIDLAISGELTRR
jgi:benzoylformate decarboxylase